MSSYPNGKKEIINDDKIDELTLNLIAKKGRECMKHLPPMDFNKIKNPVLQKLKGKILNYNYNDGSKTS